VGFTHNEALDTIDLGGRNFAESAELPPRPVRPEDRVHDRRRAGALATAGGHDPRHRHPVPAGTADPAPGALIGITPTRVVSWGLDEAS